MNLFRVNRLPLYQAPDMPAAAPAGDPPPAPVADPPAADPPAADLPTPMRADDENPVVTEPAVDKPHGNKGRKPWYLDRISEETAARQQAEERARNAEALLERSQARAPGDPPAAPRADDSAIETRARQIADERVNGERIQSVIRAGLSKFDDWDQKAEMLGAVGAASPAFVLDVVSIDPENAHLILHQLADDPQKAARLAKMDTRGRIIEITRMSMAQTAPTAGDPKPETKPAPPRSVSKAPPPPPPVEPGSSQTVDWRSDKATDQDFSKGWDAQQRERAARGRR